MTNKNISEMIAKQVENYLAMRRDKKHEDYLKSKPQNKKGNISKGINIRLSNITERLSNEKELIESINKAKKFKDQDPLDFQIKKYQALLDLIDMNSIDNELDNLKNEYSQFKTEIIAQYKPSTWLDEWTVKAKDISFATHVAKLTHSSSKGTSILDCSKSTDNRYLTTNTIKIPKIDTASSNAASLPIADILKIKHNNYSVLDSIKEDNFSIWQYFSNDLQQIETWVNNLKQAYDNNTKQSFFLAKQIYFPVGDQYHLLLPLTSSSLAQEIHIEQSKFFEDEQKEARKQKSDNGYSEEVITRYPNKARLNVTASNHSNASSLNGKRGGKITLFCAQPPTWKSMKNYHNLDDGGLYRLFSYSLKIEIRLLNEYLLLLKDKDLGSKKPERANIILKKVQSIIYELFDTILVINTSSKPNWTLDSNLSLPYQLLFEPYHKDKRIKEVPKDWQTIICKDFGRWLNKQLDKNKLELTTIHSGLWADIFKKELRSFIAKQEVALWDNI